jgi:hypothetical protein
VKSNDDFFCLCFICGHKYELFLNLCTQLFNFECYKFKLESEKGGMAWFVDESGDILII